jgi:hypothetical protein
MCNSNEGLKEKGTGNGTQCRLLKVKLKEGAKSYMCKIWNKRKVWTVCASDVEWVEFEHYPKTQTISNLEFLLRQKKQEQLDNPVDTRVAEIENIESELNRDVNLRIFKLSPKFFGKCKVHVSPNDFVLEKQPMWCSITQIPVISSDAITGHKLQGLTKDQLIIYSWNKTTSWIYVVLSRVRTIGGLFLVKSLKLSDIKPPSRDYLAFIGRMKTLQQVDLDRSRGQTGVIVI